ncbi:protein FAM210B, mitochondrial [Corythoichthys intestinalis]|uniref:protein FAM210B, mitochondrial n=1 Tax=Corythoichthys intestinalis TaxID=161448 RepID=UPI0025A68F56|nr:protein FAM210B, mitochondrial [Corythoichthys intestinalis]
MFLSRLVAARVLRYSPGPLTFTRGYYRNRTCCVGLTVAHSAGRGKEPYHDSLLTPDWGYLRRRGDLAAVFTSHQRLSTAAAAPKKSPDMDDKNNAEDKCNLKEAPPTPLHEAKAPGELESAGDKLNKTQQLKKVFKEYGAVGVSFHVGISLMSLGMFYLLISSGIDMAAVLSKLGFGEAVIRSKMAAGTSTFVLAYAVHKLFAPVRISITLVSVPLIVRHFRRTGLFKPPSSAP